METGISIAILAAGLGTRMKSRRAKVLHAAGGRTLVEHVVRTALEITPAENVTVVVGHQADQVREALDGYGVGFTVQTQQRGTGHALMAARERLAAAGGLLVVLYGDCPLLEASTLAELIAYHRMTGGAATAVTTELDNPAGYGRILRDESGRLTAIVEQKAATEQQKAIREINSGIYCFESGLLWRHIDSIRTDNPAGEYYLTDVAAILHAAGHAMHLFPVADARQLLGINDRTELAAVDAILRGRKVRQLMLDGVTIVRPETVTIDAQVSIGMDTTVGPFAQILGDSVIAGNCTIGAGAIVSGSRLAEGVEVGAYTLVADSVIGEGARVGPFARLRMGNQVGAGTAIGNFVELKNTDLRTGAKANHLAYLGDAVIEEKVNIGAGTITCNYDGQRKHRTEIGAGAFVGSNSTLVAPLQIGPGAYVAAGSVVTRSVPPDALGIGRSRQVNKEGWAAKRRSQTEAG